MKKLIFALMLGFTATSPLSALAQDDVIVRKHDRHHHDRQKLDELGIGSSDDDDDRDDGERRHGRHHRGDDDRGDDRDDDHRHHHHRHHRRDCETQFVVHWRHHHRVVEEITVCG